MKLVEWDPRKEGDPLAALVQVSAAMLHGRPALERRLGDFAGGYPSGRRSVSAGSSDDSRSAPEDAAERERRKWLREVSSSLDAACRAWDTYVRLCEPKAGVVKLTDPGCDLCAPVPGHWCPAYGTRVVVSGPSTKRKPEVRTLRLCEWCYQFTWPSRAGRLPTLEEVTAHAAGRRVRWHGGVDPKLVEVDCPECHDASREARKACRTCGHAGKVLRSS